MKKLTRPCEEPIAWHLEEEPITRLMLYSNGNGILWPEEEGFFEVEYYLKHIYPIFGHE